MANQGPKMMITRTSFSQNPEILGTQRTDNFLGESGRKIGLKNAFKPLGHNERTRFSSADNYGQFTDNSQTLAAQWTDKTDKKIPTVRDLRNF